MRNGDTSAGSWDCAHMCSKTEPLDKHSWVGCWKRGAKDRWHVSLEFSEGQESFLCGGGGRADGVFHLVQGGAKGQT